MDEVALRELTTNTSVVTALGVQHDPRVSIVIPTYNRAHKLRRLLQALADVRVPSGGMEVIVVNDGSTDYTLAVAEEAGVGCISQPNRGRARARDLGWRVATGDVIVFLDDDVVPEPQAIDRMVRALDHADAVGAQILPIDTHALIADYMHADSIVNHYVIGGRVLWLITAAAAFRREALERVNGFDLAYHQAGEDVDLTLRLVEAGGVLDLASEAVVYHEHPSRLRELWSTCNRYGRAYGTLAARHPVHREERLRSARGRANPREWLRLYRFYRAEASVRRSLVFMLLHAAVAAPYVAGLLRGGEQVPAEDDGRRELRGVAVRRPPRAAEAAVVDIAAAGERETAA